jgi:formamidopyrimidine-DNA glycosylase
MPELPEVETVARGLARRITGQTVRSVQVLRPEILHGHAGAIDRLSGRRIERVVRRGKQVLIRLDRRLSLVVHLGMTGRMVAVPPETPVEPHTHLRATFRRGKYELRYTDPRRFGGIWILTAEASDALAAADHQCKAAGSGSGRRCEFPWVGRRVPPVAADPLLISVAELRACLQRRRQIKALLLDQDPISGMGNIYCDESLYRAGIHPLTRACELGPAAVRRLHRAMRTVLNAAIRAGGSSVSDYRGADNNRGWFQLEHRVYGRKGEPCRACGTPIEYLRVAGRGTHICPKCQPWPSE